MEHYTKYGWKCIVIWLEDFENEKLIFEKIGVDVKIKEGETDG